MIADENIDQVKAALEKLFKAPAYEPPTEAPGPEDAPNDPPKPEKPKDDTHEL